ncbi:MAG: S1C family serine protease [Oscillospiraceae bacterium]|nr:S1C family serine protease [Oscillospiraceae bacterium]
MNEWERKSESSGVWTMPTSAQETPGQEETAPRPAYSDANYVPASEAAAIPKTYHCTPPPEKKTKEPRRGVSVLGLIAACLVCAILGGILGGWLPGLLGGGTAAPETRAESGVVLNVAAPADAETATSVSTNLVSDSGQKSATDLYYDLALNQTVAVTTEITNNNVWGFRVPGAVKGSGFLISEDGYILTNHHVIEDAVNGGYQVQVLLGDGSEYDAQVVGYEADNDVAVLKIDATGLSPVTLGDSDRIRVGETVYAVGNPLGELEFTMTSGMVSATDRAISSSDGNGNAVTINMFQIDAAINSGNSGGPIYNSRGEVIGIATAKYASTGVEGLGFAIPINDAVAIARDLISDGYVHGKASIGITVDTVSAAAAQYYGLRQGAIVASVSAGSAAEQAGLQASDIIIEMDGKTITSRDDLIQTKRGYQAGDTVELKVFRSGEILTLSLTFDEEVPATAEETPSAEENQTGREDQGGYGYGFNFGDGYDSYEDFFSQLFPFSYR